MCSVVKQNIHFLGISRFSHSLLLVLISPVVQFSMIDPPSLSRTASVLYHILPLLSRGFAKVFWKNFKSLFRGRSLGVSARWQLAYYSTAKWVCQAVFDKKIRFGGLFDLADFDHRVLCIITKFRGCFTETHRFRLRPSNISPLFGETSHRQRKHPQISTKSTRLTFTFSKKYAILYVINITARALHQVRL